MSVSFTKICTAKATLYLWA